MKPRSELVEVRDEIRALDAKWDEALVEGEHGLAIDQSRVSAMYAEMRCLLAERLVELGVDLYRWSEEKDLTAEALDKLAKQYADGAKAMRQRAERARALLLELLVEQGMTVIEGEALTLKVQNGPPAVVQTDPSLELLDMDDRFLRFKDPEVNKQAIKKAIQEGESVRGFALESRPHLLARVRS